MLVPFLELLLPLCIVKAHNVVQLILRFQIGLLLLLQLLNLILRLRSVMVNTHTVLLAQVRRAPLVRISVPLIEGPHSVPAP